MEFSRVRQYRNDEDRADNWDHPDQEKLRRLLKTRLEVRANQHCSRNEVQDC
jgi:hypothetical protein